MLSYLGEFLSLDPINSIEMVAKSLKKAGLVCLFCAITYVVTLIGALSLYDRLTIHSLSFDGPYPGEFLSSLLQAIPRPFASAFPPHLLVLSILGAASFSYLIPLHRFGFRR